MSQFTKLMLSELFEGIVQKKVCLYQIKNTYYPISLGLKKKKLLKV